MSTLSWSRLTLGSWLWLTVGLVVAAVGTIVVSDWMVRRSAAGKCHDDVRTVPESDVGLVLGCAPMLSDGQPNRFFTKRIATAVELYQAGKVKALIVSGDNHREGYDEPTAMKEALVAEGLPESRIYCDYAGFRTLDSVVRAREIFGQEQLVIVSQRFHNERAVYLAERRGLVAVALNAGDVPLRAAAKTYLRERFARVKAVLDVTLFGTGPKFLGERVEVVMD